MSPVRWRVSSACGWTGYRVHPQARPCRHCGLPVTTDWKAGEAPSHVFGVVYLAHIEPRYRHAGHYLGTAVKQDERWFEHLNGNGSKLTHAAVAAGCRLTLVRTWPGGRTLEKTFKSSRPGGGAKLGLGRYCPLCNPRAATYRPMPGQWLLGMTAR